MSGKKNGAPGHCKAVAKRIHAEAELIAAKLAKGELCREMAKDYGCCYNIFVKHVQAAIGVKRWKAIVHPGIKKGHVLRQGITEVPQTDAGPSCWYCGKSITPDTLVCRYCGTRLQG